MSDCSSMHSIWKLAGNIFMSTENGVEEVAKYCFPRNLEICFQILVSNQKPRLHIFHCSQDAVFSSQRVEMHKTVCLHLSLPSFSFIWSAVVVWNVCLFNSFKWKVKSIINTKSVSQISSWSSGTNLFFDTISNLITCHKS